MTRRLYHDDPWQRTFHAPVVAHHRVGDSIALELAESAFYPESGGQPADSGTIEGWNVTDVQIDQAERVLHVLKATDPAATLPAVGATVHGLIDWPKRRAHMALHTGQHMLSAALAKLLSADTVSSRLAATGCTVDVTGDRLGDAALADAEQWVNQAIDDDVPVRAWFPSRAELATLPLRRDPKVTDNVRVIDVQGFDLSPCGGTHVARTGQLGLLRVLGLERKKGLNRVTFQVGRLARDVLWERDRVLRGLATDLTCGPVDVPAAMLRLLRDKQAAQDELGRSRSELARLLADALLLGTVGDVVATFEGRGAELVGHVARHIVAAGRGAFLAERSDAGSDVWILLPEGDERGAGVLLGAITKAAGGRGGGRPQQAQGRLPQGADWAALVERVRAPAV